MRIPIATAVMLVLLALATGCQREKAQDGCRRYLEAINANYDRCSLIGSFTIRTRDGRTGCEIVDRYAAGDGQSNIEEACIPWANAVRCEDFDPESLPAFCDGSNFEYIANE